MTLHVQLCVTKRIISSGLEEGGVGTGYKENVMIVLQNNLSMRQ